jgi:dUTP pyrophosphatase
MTKVQFIKVNPNAMTPVRGSKFSAGYDLSACIDKKVIIPPHSTVKIGTGLAIKPPEGYWGAIFARSGLATKQGLRPANCVGVVDEDYRGEYIVALHNDTDTTQYIEPNERIAQLVFLPYLNCEFEEVEALDKTERDSGGFGSTGK